MAVKLTFPNEQEATTFLEHVDWFQAYERMRVAVYRKLDRSVTVMVYGLPVHLEPELKLIAAGAQP